MKFFFPLFVFFISFSLVQSLVPIVFPSHHSHDVSPLAIESQVPHHSTIQLSRPRRESIDEVKYKCKVLGQAKACVMLQAM